MELIAYLTKKHYISQKKGNNVVSFMNNNELYNKDMKGNEVFDNLLKGNDSKVADIMGINNDELAAVKTITNLKAKLGKESLSYTLKDTSVKIIKFWNNFKHYRHNNILIVCTNYLTYPTRNYYLRNPTDPLCPFKLMSNPFYTYLFTEGYGPLLFTESYQSHK